MGSGTALLVMLLVFGSLAGLTLLATVGPPEVRPAGPEVSVAYGPADFPEVFSTEIPGNDPLEGLDPESDEPFRVPRPPFNDPEVFPCSDCHEGDPGDPTRRELIYHEEIVLQHDTENRWCLDCHLDSDRDSLHLADMTPITFEESYRLCGQCHGTQYRDWRFGVHGRRTGYWDGPQRYLLCVHCHDPHSPAFAPMEPLPPPVSPWHQGSSARPASASAGTPTEGGDDAP